MDGSGCLLFGFLINIFAFDSLFTIYASGTKIDYLVKQVWILHFIQI
jgi:hypothetical protein